MGAGFDGGSRGWPLGYNCSAGRRTPSVIDGVMRAGFDGDLQSATALALRT
jgi:hypothetical protein